MLPAAGRPECMVGECQSIGNSLLTECFQKGLTEMIYCAASSSMAEVTDNWLNFVVGLFAKCTFLCCPGPSPLSCSALDTTD